MIDAENAAEAYIQRECGGFSYPLQLVVRKAHLAGYAAAMQWRPIESAPKDGTPVLLLSAAHDDDFGPDNGGVVHFPPKVAIGTWNPNGDSWVDEYGRLGMDCYALADTGSWSSGTGWFQPNEVTHWMPLPLPPSE